MPDYDAVVCGAGIGGLTAGAALSRNGHRVLVVDKQQRDVVVHKGELLQPRSLEVFSALGALEPLRRGGAIRVERLECRQPDGALIGALDYGLLDAPHDHMRLDTYAGIKAAMVAAAPGMERRGGVRATGLLRAADGRVAGVRVVEDGRETTVTATVTIAADGRSSALRKAAGIGFGQQQYDHRLVAFDLAAPPPTRQVVAFLTPCGLRLLYPMPHDRARLYVQVTPDEVRAVGRDRLVAWTAALVAATPVLRPLADPLADAAGQRQVLPAWRADAPTWAVPGLALVGDAAHCVHPMAGQGMNAAIADAWALGERLGDGPLDAERVDAALTRYDAQRRPQLDYVSRLSHNLATLFTDTTPWRRRLGQHVLARNQDNRRLQFLLTYNMSGLGVRRFTLRDRVHQFGLWPDPHAAQARL